LRFTTSRTPPLTGAPAIDSCAFSNNEQVIGIFQRLKSGKTYEGIAEWIDLAAQREYHKSPELSLSLSEPDLDAGSGEVLPSKEQKQVEDNENFKFAERSSLYY
jgi:hypothetical protein